MTQTEDRSTAQPLWSDVDDWREKYEEEKAIVDRVWKALGVETYEHARGLAIDELVAEAVNSYTASQKRIEALIAKLRECAKSHDPEVAHGDADEALLDFINNPEVIEAWQSVEKWYA